MTVFFKNLLSNIQNLNVNSPNHLRNCYPVLINSSKNNYSYSGSILTSNNSENYNQKFLTSSLDVRFKSTQHVKSASIKKEENNTIEEVHQKKIDVAGITRGEKLKKAVKEYGSTVIVFHIGISLVSLGTCYLLVSSGLDVTNILEVIGLNEWITKSEITASAGTFAVAYAIHKVFAPVRITITVGSVPFIVKYLRKVGLLKK
ncbi:hypothetical protein NQ314_010881 [Rhamnusium bicolor]|uniref:DUF1279 domain-containing protein n=1 Tax=Rhamnusium bicolor TaxID=1586634 RepID=A0AAV8XMS8_9CUCU|nr:hypothetical protein NQ314_010881 [Rhamnusium bicolor]